MAIVRERRTDRSAGPSSTAGEVARRILLPLVLMALVTLGVGLLLTKVLEHSALVAQDAAISREIAEERTPFWNRWSDYASTLSDTPVIIVVTAVMVVVFRLAYRRWREAIFLVAVVCAQSAIFLLATVFAQRDRPDVRHLDPAPPTSSFPSGHTSAAVAFYCGVALVLTLHTHRHTILNALWWLLGAGAALAVGLSRLYRGMHHVTDVSWGFVLGFCCVAVLAQALLLRPIAAVRRGAPPSRDARRGLTPTGR